MTKPKSLNKTLSDIVSLGLQQERSKKPSSEADESEEIEDLFQFLDHITD